MINFSMADETLIRKMAEMQKFGRSRMNPKSAFNKFISLYKRIFPASSKSLASPISPSRYLARPDFSNLLENLSFLEGKQLLNAL